MLSRSTKMKDNVIQLDSIRKTKDPVARICNLASKEFKELLLIGENKEGQLKMVTTIEEPADMLYMLEIVKLGLITKGAENEEK
tara:strand:+ start:13 stop:264 length:252 start_codon:yes stop_codon:yes gene_type:complete